MSSKRDDDLAFEIVRSVIHEWNPFGLLAEGRPNEDEFDSEIRAIAKQRSRIRGQNDTVAVVLRVFRSSFNDSGEFCPEACTEVGHKIFKGLLEADLLEIE